MPAVLKARTMLAHVVRFDEVHAYGYADQHTRPAYVNPLYVEDIVSSGVDGLTVIITRSRSVYVLGLTTEQVAELLFPVTGWEGTHGA